MKKVFIISSVLLVLVLAFLGVYNFVFKNNASNPVADPNKKAQAEKEAEATTTPTGPIEPVMNEPVLGATSDGKILYFYSLRDHQFKRSGLDGSNPTPLFGTLPSKPARIVWSPSREKVLVFVSDPGPLWYTLDFTGKSLVPLKPGMDRLAWANVGESILYEYSDPATHKNSLNVANPDGSNWKKLSDLPDGSFYLSAVPQSSLISFWKKPSGLEANTVKTLPLVGGEPKTIVSNHFGADILWAKDGNHVLITSLPEKASLTPSLAVANDQGGEYRDLLVPTLISKVAWSQDHQTVFYAQPNPFPAGSILPGDYFSKPIFTKDTFWRMDITSGKKERLVPLESMDISVDATDLFLSGDEGNLFFTDRLSSKLYHIKL